MRTKKYTSERKSGKKSNSEHSKQFSLEKVWGKDQNRNGRKRLGENSETDGKKKFKKI